MGRTRSAAAIAVGSVELGELVEHFTRKGELLAAAKTELATAATLVRAGSSSDSDWLAHERAALSLLAQAQQGVQSNSDAAARRVAARDRRPRSGGAGVNVGGLIGGLTASGPFSAKGPREGAGEGEGERERMGV